jgi:hypothetical protein
VENVWEKEVKARAPKAKVNFFLFFYLSFLFKPLYFIPVRIISILHLSREGLTAAWRGERETKGEIARGGGNQDRKHVEDCAHIPPNSP